MSVQAGIRVLVPCLCILLSATQAHALYSYSDVVAKLQEWSARPCAEESARLRVVRLGTTVKGRAILMAVLGGAETPPLESDETAAEDPGPWATPATTTDPAGQTEPATPADEGDTEENLPPDGEAAAAEGDTEENALAAAEATDALVLALEPAEESPAPTESATPEAADEAPPVLPSLPNGPRRVFVVGRQHGNEPAPTEAILRFLEQYAGTTDPAKLELLRRVTFYVVPMLNADGAVANQRRNARNVDLNRDWVKQSQPETQTIVRAVREIQPHLVVDLHELHPTDRTASFVEAMEKEAGASAAVGAACNAAIAAVVGPLRAQSTTIYARPVNNYREPRLMHRYFAVREGIPAILVETRRHGNTPLETRTATHYAALQATARYLAGYALQTPQRVQAAWLEPGPERERALKVEQLARTRAAQNRQLAGRRGSASTDKKREALRKQQAARKKSGAKR